MRVAVGLLTCERPELLRRTLGSLGSEVEVIVIDNAPKGSRLPAAGFAEAAKRAYDTGAQIVMLSPDDFEYRPGWLATLRRFWEAAPRAVAIAGSALLPVFDHSVPFGGLECGGVKALIRPVTIAAWSFRAEDYYLTQIEVAKRLWEKAICWRVAAAGRLVCEIDLAEHIGEQHSSLGHTPTWQAAASVEPYVRRWMG